MPHWDDLRFLLAVVNNGSAGAAATALHVNHATVSRRISDLETRLNTHLVDRSSLAWKVTPAGLKIAEKAAVMERAADDARRIAEAQGSDMAGIVRITTGETAFKSFVLDALLAVRRQLPEIRFELIARDDVLDLSSRSADIAIRFTKIPDPNLFGQRICSVGYGLYGTQKLVADFISQIEQKSLARTPLVLFGATNNTGNTGHALPEWARPSFAPDAPTDRVDTIQLHVEAAKKALGLAALPHILAHDAKQLMQVPHIAVPSTYDIWILANADTQTSARIRAVKAILIDQISAIQSIIESGIQSNNKSTTCAEPTPPMRTNR